MVKASCSARMERTSSIPTDGESTCYLSRGRRIRFSSFLLLLGFAPQDANGPELYVVGSDGSFGPTKLDHRGGRIATFQVSSDGIHVVYQASRDRASALYSVPILRGGEAVQLTDRLVSFDAFMISPDGGGVVYSAEVDAAPQLFSVPIRGGQEPVKLNGPLVEPYGGVQVGFQISPDGERVVFRADADVLGVHDLFSAPIGSSEAAVRLSSPMSEGQVVADVSAVQVSSDGIRAVFRVNVSTVESDAESDELYSVALDGERGLVKLFPPGAGPLFGRDDIAEFRINSRGDWVVFRAGNEEGLDLDLFGVPIGGRIPPVRLNEHLQSGYGPEEFELTPDGRLAVYSQYDDDDVLQLFVVPVEGSSPPGRLSRVPPTNLGAPSFAIGPDGSRAVYRADQEAGDVFELYSVPIDGASAALKISGPLVAGGDVQSPFQISPEGQWVVYGADQQQDEVFEVYSVPIDRSARPTKVSGPLPAGGDVVDFRIGPDGRDVLYRADQRSDEVFELFRTPIDRSKQSERVNAPLVEAGDVSDRYGLPLFEITPDSDRILYVADQDTDSVHELYLALREELHSRAPLKSAPPPGKRY